VAITRPEARTNAQKGLSGKESDPLRVENIFGNNASIFFHFAKNQKFVIKK
jgi:hypothetical protein